MESIDRSTLAGFRCLVAVAKADGQIDPGELDLLTVAIKDEALLSRLLNESFDIDEEVALLGDEQRQTVYRSAFTLAHVDDRMAHDEVEILEKIWPDAKEESLLEEVVSEVWDTVHPSAIKPIADPAKRQDEISHDTIKYCIIAAIVGATPVPGLAIIADAAVVAIQVKLVRDIGQYWGHDLDAAAARSLIGAAAGSIGVRMAFFNLARVVPGWGSAVAAAGSFATTYAMAEVANAYFGSGREMNENAMRDMFKKARTEGESAYDARKSDIDRVQGEHTEEIGALAKAVADKKMSASDYENRLMDAIDADADQASR